MTTAMTWIEDPASVGLRMEGLAHKIDPGSGFGGPIRHTGWYLDSECPDETVAGVVYRLPHERFVAGYADPWNTDKDGYGPACLDLSQILTDLDTAVRHADDCANRMAEAEREYQYWDRMRQDIENGWDELRDLRTDLHGSGCPRCRTRIHGQIDLVIRNLRSMRDEFEHKPRHIVF